MTRRWWINTEPMYRRFSPVAGRDASEAVAMYQAETFGHPLSNADTNRYAIGKRNMDATVSMWAEDIGEGLLFKGELKDDPTFYGLRKWLDKVLRRIMPGRHSLLPETR